MKLHDLHCHTNLSLCAKRDADIETYIKNADEEGLFLIGFSDHAWDRGLGNPISFYASQNYERLLERKAPENRKVKVVFGAEGEFAGGLLGARRETMKKFDYIIIPHSHTHMSGFVLPECCDTPEKHGRFLYESFVSLLNHRDIDCVFGIAHPFCPCGKKYDEAEEILSYITDKEFEYCGRLAADKGVFLEFNTSAAFVYPEEGAEDCSYARFFRNAKKGGAKFFLGSDNHYPYKQEENKLFRWKERAVPFGLCETDFTDALYRICRG
ncbi:MAG: hypothetical protein GX148_02020 [Clostridiales bacterium]|jgi:histidinol phosphatase-like PHP family hydrolase|nr:hypothetical protein [Clostridiales bacterium]